VHGTDLGGELSVAELAGRRGRVKTLVVGGTGDLEQLTAPVDAVTYGLLRLDEGLQLHRVSFAKKAVARFKISTSPRSWRFSAQPAELVTLGRGQPRAGPGVDLGLLDPLAHCGLGQVEVPGDLADRAVTTTAQLDDLSLELRGERPPRTTRLPILVLHDRHPLRGQAPDGGCPSNRAYPSARVAHA
jgi:hypothetical protein